MHARGCCVCSQASLKWSPVVERVGALMESNGLFRAVPGSKVASVTHAAQAFAVVAIAARHGQDQWLSDSSDEDSADAYTLGVANTVLQVSVPSVVSMAQDMGGGGLAFPGDDSLHLTLQVVEHALSLATSLHGPARVSNDDWISFARFFLSFRTARTDDFVTAAAAWQGLRALQALPDLNLFSADVTTPVMFDSDAQPRLQVSVTDVFGQALPTLTSVSAVVHHQHASPDAAASMPERTFAADSVAQGLFSLDGSGADDVPTSWPAGVYRVHLRVHTGSGTNSATLTFKVATRVALGPAKLIVSSSARPSKKTKTSPRKGKKRAVQDRTWTTVSVDYPSRVSTEHDIRVSDKEFLHVLLDVHSEASGAPLRPHQVFVTFVNQQSEKATVFVAHPQKSGAHLVTLDVSSPSSLHGAHEPGLYDLVVTVGDSLVQVRGVCCGFEGVPLLTSLVVPMWWVGFCAWGSEHDCVGDWACFSEPPAPRCYACGGKGRLVLKVASPCVRHC